MRRDRLQVPLNNTRHRGPRRAAFVQLEDRHQQRDLDIRLLRRRRLHLGENRKRFLLRAFIILKILIGRCGQRWNEE